MSPLARLRELKLEQGLGMIRCMTLIECLSKYVSRCRQKVSLFIRAGMLLLSPLSSGCSESPCQSLSSHCTPEPCWVRKSTTLCSHDNWGKDDEWLSCKMLVCLLQPCNTCCNFEDAFSFPIKLGNAWSHEAFFLSLDTPEITSSAEHLLGLLRLDMN